MQDISIRLFEGAFILKPRTEQRLMQLALVLMALHAGLLLYLLVAKVFTLLLVLILLLSLLVPAYFMLSVWLDRAPQYRRHLTLSAEGVRYRTRFLHPEHEFDWTEIDLVKINLYKITFVLKNEEVHEVSLEHLQNDELLRHVKEQVLEKTRHIGINLH
ncbi:hypothetical protein [Pontibacter litorisediminis]|uniref:hypothetical protein n=1 Tax=Pontibacter litorisediminis TaxID=1846260 RepID=UPI0023ED761E|nr:hypothetical protein [Pontibacter litorisediminis]